MKTLVELRTLIDQKTAQVSAIFDEADVKHGGEDPPDFKERIVALNKEIDDLEKEALDSKAMSDIRSANDRRAEELKRPVPGFVHPGGGSPEKTDHGAARKAIDLHLGALFTAMPEWQAYIKSVAPAGEVGNKVHVTSPALLLPYGFKTLITGLSDTGGGAFVETDHTGLYDALGRRPLVIRDIISVRTTGSDTVDFVRQTSRVNAAAVVAEAIASDDGSGAKPEGGFGFERDTANIRTIAEWVPATKRSLSDVGQLKGIIDDELRSDLEEAIETEIMTGDGTGEHFEGVDAVSGTQDQAFSVDALQTLRKGRTLIRTVGRAIPTAYVMNPTDWETIDLLKDNENRYYYGGPSEMGTPRIWGLPVVESEAQPAGNAWCADWRRAVLWDREVFTISASDSHSDFYIRNLVAILGELRAGFAVIRPAAFIECDIVA